MPTIKYPKHPNIDTAFVEQDDGTRNRALMVAPQDISTLELPNNPNSTKGYVTIDGKKQRVILTADISGAGGDQHNLGYYATQAALEEAYPTAEAGDWAIVGATDTVWIWDTDNSAWVDSDQKGQVTSVNNQTGVVTIGINDILPTQTGYSGRVLGTDGFVAGWVEPESVQRDTMPQADENEVDNIYQFIGTTDANYTNGYFYKCVSDGQNPATYSWTRVDVQPTPNELPSQTGQSGKYLTTNGTTASWATINALTNNATGSNSVLYDVDSSYLSSSNSVSLKSYRIGNYSVAEGVNAGCGSQSVAIGYMAGTDDNGIAIGYWVGGSGNSISIGYGSSVQNGNTLNIALGNNAAVDNNASNAIQIGNRTTSNGWTNSDSNTFKVGNANGNFELMSADGTIPADRLKNAINKYSTMPTAASTNKGWIVQYTGATDATYTHGYLYECVSDGGNPATYSWTAVSVQAGGGSSLPSQTGNSGKFLTTDGSDASWATINALTNMATANNSISILSGANVSYTNNIAIGAGITIANTNCVTIGTFATDGSKGVTIGPGAKCSSQSVCIGYESDTTGAINSTAIGYQSKAKSYNGIAIGRDANTGLLQNGRYGNVAIGNGATIDDYLGATYQFGNATNSEEGTVKFALSTDHGVNWTNYKLLDSDGTIPAARHASLPAADGTYVLKLVISGGVPTLSWVAE